MTFEHDSIILDSTNLSENNSKLFELEETYTEWSGICYKLTMKENTTKLMRNSGVFGLKTDFGFEIFL